MRTAWYRDRDRQKSIPFKSWDDKSNSQAEEYEYSQVRARTARRLRFHLGKIICAEPDKRSLLHSFSP